MKIEHKKNGLNIADISVGDIILADNTYILIADKILKLDSSYIIRNKFIMVNLNKNRILSPEFDKLEELIEFVNNAYLSISVIKAKSCKVVINEK